ncbi:hypothetical protein J4558_06980 [Leptolyngbya sp. 15MV]|nr:hypothetical protein J4558_06980 [Leptolyngbya sp. 15MV]
MDPRRLPRPASGSTKRVRLRLAAFPALPTARVWPDTVGDRTGVKDFLRAGIARRVHVLDAQGQPGKIGTGRRERIKTASASRTTRGG